LLFLGQAPKTIIIDADNITLIFYLFKQKQYQWNKIKKVRKTEIKNSKWMYLEIYNTHPYKTQLNVVNENDVTIFNIRNDVGITISIMISDDIDRKRAIMRVNDKTNHIKNN